MNPLEQLKSVLCDPEGKCCITGSDEDRAIVDHALQALAQTEQEPMAWRTFDGEGGYEYRSYDMNEQYAQEWEQRNPKHKGWVEPLYTLSPPKRPWAGLTHQQTKECVIAWDGNDAYYLCRAIEAKLKKKNT